MRDTDNHTQITPEARKSARTWLITIQVLTALVVIVITIPVVRMELAGEFEPTSVMWSLLGYSLLMGSFVILPNYAAWVLYDQQHYIAAIMISGILLLLLLISTACFLIIGFGMCCPNI